MTLLSNSFESKKPLKLETEASNITNSVFDCTMCCPYFIPSYFNIVVVEKL